MKKHHIIFLALVFSNTILTVSALGLGLNNESKQDINITYWLVVLKDNLAEKTKIYQNLVIEKKIAIKKNSATAPNQKLLPLPLIPSRSPYTYKYRFIIQYSKMNITYIDGSIDRKNILINIDKNGYITLSYGD